MVKVSNFYIDADDNLFMIKEVGLVQDENSPNFGQEKYITCGYYSTLEQAVKGLEKLLQRRSVRDKNMDLKELKEEIKTIHKDIFKQLEVGIKMSKFNVGDKVRVRKDLEVGKDYGNFTFADTMVELKGKIVTIKKAFTGSYYVEEDTKEYSWTDEMLEPVVTNWDKVKEELKLEDFINHSGICTAIHKVRKEDNWHSTRNCADCQKWLKQPYQDSILAGVEKEYLKAVIKPFRDKVGYVVLLKNEGYKEYIRIKMKDEVGMCFPDFKAGTMYKGMEIGKEYTLEDLDL